ncbi:helix-turn-helix domain-containing protein [Micromonospora terminaliae]|uniref:Helix-turn-helix domain-containing protein n=1 Tax=Micromonospora terminaliae TaxID=1914461 RepID=A0AAJ3DIV0_9ACTN|nr:helix-turn-helix domain-containing protein [Micromonospora terminaliae]NES27811.1 helix-turn-helix domain-containing protein [Micromonospora terminaliae]QGL47409.1 helix-turn-helix domain-containing protein [Micromonospora terminaliae]
MSTGDRWSAMAALVDRSRRALYDYVCRADHPVTREEAAEAHGMSRNLTAFHLDKLVESGLLRSRYEPPADQPRGRGRTPKVYETAGDGVAITVPERRYELIAEILADAVADDPHDAPEAARRHARRRGRDLGAAVRDSGADLAGALAGLGFEPEALEGQVLLRNCPFHALATRQTALVCGLNHAFLTGLVDGAGRTDLLPRLAPHPGACCVRLDAVPER